MSRPMSRVIFILSKSKMIGPRFMMVFITLESFAKGCTTPGIMPLRDRAFRPFCCHPAYATVHCPNGSLCEQDTYYGHGFVCCGPVQMVWDAYGGNYKRWEYDGCKNKKPTNIAPSNLGPQPNWTHLWNLTGQVGYDCMPMNWREADGPLVVPIIAGEYKEFWDSKNGGWKGKSSVTLVKDGQCTILVDTGAAMDQKTLINGLASFGLRPEEIQYVVITQSTPDHMGNQNLFPNSKILYSWISIDRDQFSVTNLGKHNFIRLCSQTELHLTQGVTKDAVSLFVRNVAKYGSIAIVGDLFLYDHAYDFVPKQFASFVWDVQALLQSREKVLCLVDWIVPGHGSKFSVQAFMRTFSVGRHNCSNVLTSLANEKLQSDDDFDGVIRKKILRKEKV